MKRLIDSIVIVNHNDKGFSACIRCFDKTKDIILSADTKDEMYAYIDNYVYAVTRII